MSKVIALFVWVVILFVFVCGALILSCLFWRRLYHDSTNQNSTHFVQTKDHLRLALHRYEPAGSPQGLPVLLIHGLSSNRFAFDLPAAPSMACFLRDTQKDVWILELRGSGMSERPPGLLAGFPRWDFEAHLEHDLSTAIRHILDTTGASAIHLVGHSMGGILAQAYISRNGLNNVASIATLGASLFLADSDNQLTTVFTKISPLLAKIPICPLPILAKLMLPAAHFLPQFYLGFFNPRNIEPRVLRRVFALGEEIVSPSRLWSEFAIFRREGIVCPRGDKTWVSGFCKSKTPALLIAGAADEVVPEELVKRLFEQTNGNTNSKFITLGKETGCVKDYGHMDLRVGKRAAEEVFPIIADWLTVQDVAKPSS